MSYSIIYEKQFIKAEKDGKTVYFPMVYGGSNNLYEAGSGRRVRNWGILSIKDGKKYYTLEEMIEYVEKERADTIEKNKEDVEKYGESWGKYSDKNFGYFQSLAIGGHHTTTTTFGMFKGIFITGCKKALTVEELRELGVTVRIYTSIYSKEELVAYHEAGKVEINFYPKTSEELMEQLEYSENHVEGTNVSLYVEIHASEYTMKNIRRKKFSPEVKDRKPVEKNFVIANSEGNYIVKNYKNSYTHTINKQFAKMFATKGAAKRYAENIQKYFDKPLGLEVESIKG